MSKRELAMATTADRRWRAVESRDAKSDGTFVYAVKTTGIYCRPSCPARRPNAENVVFYTDNAAAERAGFRACKRCKPDQTSATEHQSQIVASVCDFIGSASEPPTLGQLAKVSGLSSSHLHRVFKEVTGLTPREYVSATRADRVRHELASSDSVTAAIFRAGYNAPARFYEESDSVLGMTPRQYRSGGRAVTIRFAVGQCTLGSILVAQSERGICAIFLGDDPDQLTRDLQDQFPAADLVGGDREFEQTVAEVVGCVESPGQGLTLPLDIQGTAFQQRVWRALQEIEPGRTVSYSELAERLDAPRSARAVARACAANKLAVAIPCHRVVRRDGDPAGYRWGAERKQTLLNCER